MIFPKLSFRFNAILIKILSELCIDIDKSNSKLCGKVKGIEEPNNFEKEEQNRRNYTT